MDDSLIFGALKSIKENSLHCWVDHFDNDEILLAKNEKNGYVGGRSIAIGMGLDWSGQRKKIKKNSIFVDQWSTVHIKSGVIGLHRDIIPDYLRAIDLTRLSEETAEKVRKYQKEFPEFIYDTLETIADAKIVGGYIPKSRDEKAIYAGMEQLVLDALCRMQNQGAVKLMASLLTDLMKSDCLSSDGLRATEHIYDLADLAARNRNRLKSVA